MARTVPHPVAAAPHGRAGRPTWRSLVANRFWLLVPVLALDLAVTDRLPASSLPGGPGSDAPSWVLWAETGLRLVVVAAPLLMPLSVRAPGARTAVAVYLAGLAAYAASWLAVLMAPTSAWSASGVGSSAPAWTSILFLAGIGWASSLRFVPGYRPAMYLAAAALFTLTHTAAVVL